ncbi:TetR/AcrR family transcriptional regulator [Aeromicrobium sp. CTD01-1L150]|uniref:TetR/AcrR family transcriptional regulator n=1 Tax=Aeromicrobium sp. CTD01-1L150 TaxID=3341830 RepID=UPI0035C0A565
MTTSASPTRRPYARRMPLEQRREQLMDAALAIIVREGYGAVTVDAVAREAQVTRPVVYGAFDGLRGVLQALLDRQQERAGRRLMELLPSSIDPADPAAAVGDAARALLAEMRHDPLTWRPILLSPGNTPDVVRERIDATRDEVVALVSSVVARTPAASRGAVDADVLAHGIVGAMEHLGRLVVADPDRFDPEDVVRSVTAVVRSLA